METYHSSPTSLKLRRLIPQCPVCEKNLSGHEFVEIATTIANEDNKARVQELLVHVKQHNWSAIREYRDFRGDQNDVVVYAIRGPHNKGVVFLIRSPFELYEADEIYLQERLCAEEIAVISTLVPAESWLRF